MMSNPGKAIKRLRLARNMTLDDLAAKANVSKSYIWELENKNPPRPSADKLIDISEALQVTLNHLLGIETIEEAEDKIFIKQYRNLKPKYQQIVRNITKVLGSG